MYEPTNWKTGDVVTSAKLNKLEQGVASCGLVVHVVADATTEVQTKSLDKTYKQIKDAIENGFSPVILADYEGGAKYVDLVDIYGFNSQASVYAVHLATADVTYTTDSEDGYPTSRQA